MDQYVITFNYSMLYFDMLELIQVMKDSKNEYIEPYIDSLQKIVDEQTKNKESISDYEYEMLIDDNDTPFEINTWIPIATDRIKDISRIDEYISKGLIRKKK
jgi:hypothetical protein